MDIIGNDSSVPRGAEEIYESIPEPRRPAVTNTSAGGYRDAKIIEPNPSIETTPIDAMSAFEVFQGKLYTTAG